MFCVIVEASTYEYWKYGDMFNDFFKSTAQKGREYSHWIDLTLNSHFEAVISEIYRTEVRFLSKSTFWGSKQRSKKVQKGPAAPKPIFSEGGG